MQTNQTTQLQYPFISFLVVGALAIMLSSSSSAQIGAKVDTPVVHSHQHLNVTSIAEHRRFWVDALGGSSVKIGATDNVAFPGVLLRLRQQAPTGGSKGTAVNHLGFQVPDIRKTVLTLREAGYPIITASEVTTVKPEDVKDGVAYIPSQATNVAFIMGPDSTKVEIFENTALRVPIAMHHLHFAASDIGVAKAWYLKALGGESARRGTFETVELPGVSLRWTAAPEPPDKTAGRVLDHIGFEVTDLASVCRTLESKGIICDRSQSKKSELGITAALVTDPSGTAVELTEGLHTWLPRY